jgi:hypothetical protein
VNWEYLSDGETKEILGSRNLSQLEFELDHGDKEIPQIRAHSKPIVALVSWTPPIACNLQNSSGKKESMQKKIIQFVPQAKCSWVFS